MPNATMKKLIGVGSSDERKSLLKLLTKFGCVQVVDCEDSYGGDPLSADKDFDEATVKLARLDFVKRFLGEQKIAAKTVLPKEKKSKDEEDKEDKKAKELPLMLRPKPEIDFETFSKAREWEGDTWDKVKILEDYNTKLISLKAERTKLINQKEQISVYKDIKVPLSTLADTTYAKVLVGVCNGTKAMLLAEIESAFPNAVIEIYGSDTDSIRAVVVICSNEDAEAVAERLGDIDFVASSYLVDKVPSDLIDEIDTRLAEIDAENIAITKDVMDSYQNDDFTLEIGVLDDFYHVELQKVAAVRKMKSVKSTYLFEAWLPSTAEEIIDKKLESSPVALAYVIRDAIEGEEPPTFCENNSIVTPYQSVTNMFNVPSYSEINPNPFVAFFFILFFGVMISDAGYGLLLTLGTGIFLAIKKPRKYEMSLVKIIFAGGLSTIFWGVLFGGYFGIDTALLDQAGIWYWFSPINDPIMMLALSLGLGLFQMLTGMAINAYSLFKQHKPLDAVFGVFSWYALLIGLAMFALGGGIAGVKYTGIALLAMGLVGLMVAGALHKKGMKVVSGAFGNLYGIVNFFSDLLSYTRLFGLGLATGVIALVFNQIAQVLIGMNVVIGGIMAPVILIVGHLFNIGINTLGAYIHNSRLQFVEFFGKFYEGGGSEFVPLGSAMKNYNFKIEEDCLITEGKEYKEKKKCKKVS